MAEQRTADAVGPRALAHPLRLRLLSLLTARAMSGSEAARELGESQANVSYHLRRLRDAGLLVAVDEPGRGRTQRYRHDPASGERLTGEGPGDQPVLAALSLPHCSGGRGSTGRGPRSPSPTPSCGWTPPPGSGRSPRSAPWGPTCTSTPWRPAPTARSGSARRSRCSSSAPAPLRERRRGRLALPGRAAAAARRPVVRRGPAGAAVLRNGLPGAAARRPAQHRSFAAAGAATGAFGLANVLVAAARARLVDRLGQPVALPRLAVAYAVLLCVLAELTTSAGVPAWLLVAVPALAGLCPPPLGAAMRALRARLTEGTGSLPHVAPPARRSGRVACTSASRRRLGTSGSGHPAAP